MFGLPLVQLSTHVRSGPSLWLAEVVATAGLVLLIFGLARTGREPLAPAAVAAYIGAAYWFTSSTSFANPAVTIGRAFTDTFAGIAPASVPAFIAAQLVGAVVGVVVCFRRCFLGATSSSARRRGPSRPRPTPTTRPRSASREEPDR